jgi:hypothetical protein
MAVNDLAGSSVYAGLTPQQLLAGNVPLGTNRGLAGGNLTKYQLGAVLADGSVVAFVTGTHSAAQAVLVMQPCATGQQCQYAHTGIFNDAIVSWPAGAALDTYEERKAFFTGTFKVNKLALA